MSYDYSKLKGRIIEKYNTNRNFAQNMNISERSLSLKLNNKVQWTQNEILVAAKLLGIKENEIPIYFFKVIVQIN